MSEVTTPPEIKRQVTHDHFCGEKYGMLTLIKLDGYRLCGRSRNPYFLCKCDCGKLKRAELRSMRAGTTLSCGCLLAKSTKTRFITHGMSKSAEYQARKGMIRRCYNKKHISYKNYGGRGVTVCDRWIKSFENFFEDMGLKPDKDYTLERIDNNKGYSKENCKWATWKEQNNNRRAYCTKKNIIYNGESKSMSEWVRILKVGDSWLFNKVNKQKLDFAEIVNQSKTYKQRKSRKK